MENNELNEESHKNEWDEVIRNLNKKRENKVVDKIKDEVSEEESKKLLDAEFEELFNNSFDNKSINLNVKGEEIGNSENLLSNEDDASDMTIDTSKKLDKYNFDVEEFVDNHLAYLKQKEEEKEKKYYVEPVEQHKDFSEHGDFAEVMQAAHESEYREYLKKVQEMKKKRAEDEKREKAQEKIKKEEAARRLKEERLSKKLKTLSNKIIKLGLSGKAVDFNDKMKWIQIETFRPFYRIVDHSGKGILSAEFVEISATERAFYFYDRCNQIYKLYKWDTVDLRYGLDHSCERQQDLWIHIKSKYPENNYGFKFVRNNFE